MSGQKDALTELELIFVKGAEGAPFETDTDQILNKMRKRNDALKAQSKPLEELVVAVEGRIISPPEQTSYRHTITSDFERIIGGRSPKYDAGQSITTTFRMIDKRVIGGVSYPQLDIIFEGPTALKFEDFMKVYLLLGKNREYEELGGITPLSSGDITFVGDVAQSVWVPRELEGKEKALRIVKYAPESKKLVAIYTDSSYFKELGLDISKMPLIYSQRP